VTSGGASKYETLGVLGKGGMATVFLGRARGAAGFTRLVAVKRAHPHVRGDAALAASMKHEAGLAARLHHPNVVRVIDVVEESGDLVLVLDYVEGGSLAELLEHAGAPFDARARARVVVRILLDIAAGLDAAHRALDDDGQGLGIVHRDVSPSNVLVGTDGIARLTDFGIAKAFEAGPELTAVGELKGKIAYMAPEYVEHQRADPASDQFSLAVVAWESLAGRRLFRGPTEVETLKRVLICRVPSLSEIEPILAPIEAVLARALSRFPADRFGSVRDMAERLEAAARAADLVAPHGEVGELVESALREDLAARRCLVRGGEGMGEGSARSASAAPAARSGRDDVATSSLVVSHAAPQRPSPPRSRRPVLALAVAIAVAAGAVVAWRVQSSPKAPELEAASTSPSSELAPATSLTMPSDPVEPADVAASSAPHPSARPARSTSGAGRRGAPSGGIVPRKAPPNPYVH
jgi:eukaryotic-like serine/threonine-protein kinase